MPLKASTKHPAPQGVTALATAEENQALGPMLSRTVCFLSFLSLGLQDTVLLDCFLFPLTTLLPSECQFLLFLYPTSKWSFLGHGSAPFAERFSKCLSVAHLFLRSSGLGGSPARKFGKQLKQISLKLNY